MDIKKDMANLIKIQKLCIPKQALKIYLRHSRKYKELQNILYTLDIDGKGVVLRS